MCRSMTDLEVALLGSFFEEEQGGVGHAKGEYDLICMYMIPSLHITSTLPAITFVLPLELPV